MMRDEELQASPELKQDQDHTGRRLIQPHTKPLIHFGYFVLVLMILSVVFSLIKVMSD